MDAKPIVVRVKASHLTRLKYLGELLDLSQRPPAQLILEFRRRVVSKTTVIDTHLKAYCSFMLGDNFPFSSLEVV